MDQRERATTKRYVKLSLIWVRCRKVRYNVYTSVSYTWGFTYLHNKLFRVSQNYQDLWRLIEKHFPTFSIKVRQCVILNSFTRIFYLECNQRLHVHIMFKAISLVGFKFSHKEILLCVSFIFINRPTKFVTLLELFVFFKYLSTSIHHFKQTTLK